MEGRAGETSVMGMTVEISVTSATEMQLRLSPMRKVTSFMENQPSVSPGEFITVASSEAQKLKHETDTMCHEECFFATNAMNAQTFCPKCKHPERKPVPLSKVDKDGSRSLRYRCSCGKIRKTFPVRPLQPVSPRVLQQRGHRWLHTTRSKTS